LYRAENSSKRAVNSTKRAIDVSIKGGGKGIAVQMLIVYLVFETFYRVARMHMMPVAGLFPQKSH